MYLFLSSTSHAYCFKIILGIQKIGNMCSFKTNNKKHCKFQLVKVMATLRILTAVDAGRCYIVSHYNTNDYCHRISLLVGSVDSPADNISISDTELRKVQVRL